MKETNCYREEGKKVHHVDDFSIVTITGLVAIDLNKQYVHQLKIRVAEIFNRSRVSFRSRVS